MPRLNSDEALEALYVRQSSWQKEHAAAFFSTELGGIVTDPALMVVSVDDHAFHAGHAVYEMLQLTDGYLYLMEHHLDRLSTSMVRADIPLPPGMGLDQIARTLLETAAASRVRDGRVRVFASAGRGGFQLTGTACASAALYIAVSRTVAARESQRAAYLDGWRVKTSPVPPLPPYFGTLPHTGRLAQVLVQQDAEADECHSAVMLDASGAVAGAPDANVAVLTREGVLVLPPFDHAPATATALRMLQLLPTAIAEGMEGIRGVEQRPLPLAEAKAAVEVMLLGDELPVMPVSQWDEKSIGDGTAGVVALQIRAMMQDDADPESEAGTDGRVHMPVPYGVLTGMGW